MCDSEEEEDVGHFLNSCTELGKRYKALLRELRGAGEWLEESERVGRVR